MRVLLFGKDGQVGYRLQESLKRTGELISLGRSGLNGHVGNLSDISGISATIRELKPDIVINAAAYTDVEKAESEPDLAYLINAVAPRVMADAMAGQKGLLIHFSTDYVFDGTGVQPRYETDAFGPLNVYARTKLDGEQNVALSNVRSLIIRTSWVCDSRGRNFIETIARLAQHKETLSVVDDQVGAPTSAKLIANVTSRLALEAYRNEKLHGAYHLAAQGEASWYDIACYIIARLRAEGVSLAVKDVLPVSSAQYKTHAKRPLNSRLDCSKIRRDFGVDLPAWQSGVDDILKELRL